MPHSKPKSDADFMCWAEYVLGGCEDIAYVRLTITTKDGHKHDYMQGHAPACKTCGDTACEGTHEDRSGLIGGVIGPTIGGSMYPGVEPFPQGSEIIEYPYQPTNTDTFAMTTGTAGSADDGNVASPPGTDFSKPTTGQYRDGVSPLNLQRTLAP